MRTYIHRRSKSHLVTQRAVAIDDSFHGWQRGGEVAVEVPLEEIAYDLPEVGGAVPELGELPVDDGECVGDWCYVPARAW